MFDFTIDLCEKSERVNLIQGEPNSFRYVPYVEAHFKINCSGLNKAGLFKQSCKGSIGYLDNMRFEVEFIKSDSPFKYDVLNFRYKLNDERYVETSFGIDWHERTFGKQPYFICNKTGKRVKHLLVVEGLLRTRHQFAKMNYYSEHESIQDRHLRAARKVRRRYGKDKALLYPMLLMPKPKGLHYATWESWCKKENFHYQAGMKIHNACMIKQTSKLEKRVFK
ncbi:MAG: hypothetical protein U9N57_13700 [Pseudomonadota bacterium]|nr:hypothetical protein [Pseudomonadota bacterium]